MRTASRLKPQKLKTVKRTHGARRHQVHHQDHPALPGIDGDGDLLHRNAVHLETVTSF